MHAYQTSTVMFIFFFKQKTAYEMRISDWSSDVCSSDLIGLEPAVTDAEQIAHCTPPPARAASPPSWPRNCCSTMSAMPNWRIEARLSAVRASAISRKLSVALDPKMSSASFACRIDAIRSEEHTSELQSLMRISYAVFCLKK